MISLIHGARHTVVQRSTLSQMDPVLHTWIYKIYLEREMCYFHGILLVAFKCTYRVCMTGICRSQIARINVKTCLSAVLWIMWCKNELILFNQGIMSLRCKGFVIRNTMCVWWFGLLRNGAVIENGKTLSPMGSTRSVENQTWFCPILNIFSYNYARIVHNASSLTSTDH